MHRALIGLILPLLFVATGHAQWLQERVPIDQAPRVAEGRWYFTVVYAANRTEADTKLASFLNTNEHIQRMRAAVTWNEYDTSRPIIKDTAWSKYLSLDTGGEVPCVILQARSDQDGTAKVVAFFRGKDLIDQLDRLPVRLQIAIDVATEKAVQQCPGGRCPYPILPRVPLPRPAPYPQPQPQPQPAPGPVTPPPQVTPQVTPLVPTVVPQDEVPAEPESGIPIWMFALPVIAAGAGVYRSFDRS